MDDDYRYPRPRNWHCIFCGYWCTGDFNDYICKHCGKTRPFDDGSATMINCKGCGGYSLAMAQFCEWCGLSTAQYDEWLCPFCSSIASDPLTDSVVCEGRRCACGAIALAAPLIDSDEIIDDAINLFSIQISKTPKLYDALVLEEICESGVEYLEGKRARVGADSLGEWGNWTSLWFRKQIH